MTQNPTSDNSCDTLSVPVSVSVPKDLKEREGSSPNGSPLPVLERTTRQGRRKEDATSRGDASSQEVVSSYLAGFQSALATGGYCVPEKDYPIAGALVGQLGLDRAKAVAFEFGAHPPPGLLARGTASFLCIEARSPRSLTVTPKRKKRSWRKRRASGVSAGRGGRNEERGGG